MQKTVEVIRGAQEATMESSRAPSKESAAKRYKPSMSSIIELDQLGVIDEEEAIVGAIEDMQASWMQYMPENERLQLRLQEVEKLEMFSCFQPKVRSDVPGGTRIYRHTWVDTDAKSRLTVRDLRRFGTEEQITCPTPTHTSNALFDYLVAALNLELVTFDVVSAFPHAEEQNEKIFMWPPAEWLQRDDVRDWMAKQGLQPNQVVWHLLRALYGRRSAGANFRDFLEAIMGTMDGFNFKRGDEEPCAYYDSQRGVRMLHHIDDGRVAGPRESHDAIEVVKQLGRYMLLKVSSPVEINEAYTCLGRKRVRLERGWMTIPADKHRKRIIEVLGLDKVEEGKTIKIPATPGIRRPYSEDDEQESDKDLWEYRSAVGSMIFLSLEVETISSATKELARHLHQARNCDWHALARLGRFLLDKGEYVIESTIVEPGEEHVIKVQVDANWASDDHGRSTTGVRICVNGFKVCHISQTQPGLPSLSSGEAELRALTRAGCEAIYVQAVMCELGLKSRIEIETDASAAFQAATKMSGSRMKHLVLAEKFIRKLVKMKIVRLVKIGTKKNVADIHTKHVDKDTLSRHMESTGWRQLSKDEKAAIKEIKLKAVNQMRDIHDGDSLVYRYEEALREQTIQQGLKQRTIMAALKESGLGLEWTSAGDLRSYHHSLNRSPV